MMKRIILFLFIAIGVTTVSRTSAAEAQKREMRAAWIATVYRIDWPTTVGNPTAQKAELDAYLDKFQSHNFNAVYLQVRTMCDALYNSSYEPWSSYLTGTRGKNPGYDPLQYAVEQCHARGLQCHAWINPYRWSTGSNWSTPQDQALKDADMLLSYNDGSSTYTILNPGLPATRQRIVDVIREIITNYDVDGIIFDDYFYPNGIPSGSSAPDYNLWNDSNVDMTFGDWRRNNVNMMVADVYNMIQDVKPEVRFGISPAGVAGTASTSAARHGVTPCPKGSDWQYNGIFSDPLAWLEQGTIDYISPQIYWKTTHSTNPFGPLTQWWSYVAKHFGRHHYASHSISFLMSSNTSSDWAEIVKQVNYSRQYTENNAPGAVMYSARNVSGPGMSGLGAYLTAGVFQHPAIIPAVTWKPADPISAPAGLARNGSTLNWDAQAGVLFKYSVYAVPSDVTTTDAMSATFGGIMSDYLLGVTYEPNYVLPAGSQNGYWYAVCAIDGYGNESAPAYLGVDDGPTDPDQPTPVTFSIDKVWEISDLSFLAMADARQGYGMNGKFYVNDKGSRTIYEIGPNGPTGVTYEGGSNVGFTRDEAGNLVVSDAPFPNPWIGNPVIKVINPGTGQVTRYTLPSGLVNFGRSDNMGTARGNLLEDGELYLVGANSGTTVSRIAITDGEVDTDNSYLANCDGVSPNSGTVLNYYTDASGNAAVLYVNRSSNVVKMSYDGDNFVGAAIALPDKGNGNGAFALVWDGKDYVLYPTLPNYRDGFAVAEPHAAEPLVRVASTATTDANSYQANWLNAEVDAGGVTIYQYYPGGHMTVWRLTKHGGVLRGDADGSGDVTITDVSALIDYLLSGNAEGISLEGADCDQQDGITIGDVSTLIDYLLSGNWSN